jgi:hypothetical protein
MYGLSWSWGRMVEIQMVKLYLLLLIGVACSTLTSCAMVPQMEREYLSDPAMQFSDDPLESSGESHNAPRREGSVGGGSAAGGGCGC